MRMDTLLRSRVHRLRYNRVQGVFVQPHLASWAFCVCMHGPAGTLRSRQPRYAWHAFSRQQMDMAARSSFSRCRCCAEGQQYGVLIASLDLYRGAVLRDQARAGGKPPSTGLDGALPDVQHAVDERRSDSQSGVPSELMDIKVERI